MTTFGKNFVQAGLVIVIFCAMLRSQRYPTPTGSSVPPLIQVGATLTDQSGNPLTGVVGVTFALYAAEQSESPLWVETQNVTPDAQGRFVALLGATHPEGIPLELFSTGQAHWLGIQVAGQPEQPRTFLASAPYALATANNDKSPTPAMNSAAGTTQPQASGVSNTVVSVTTNPQPGSGLQSVTTPLNGSNVNVNIIMQPCVNSGQTLEWISGAWTCATPVNSVTAQAGLTSSTTSTGAVSVGLANNSITVNTGNGLSGGGTVALGGTITLTNNSPSLGGTINAVNTSSGLTGGGTSGAVTLGIDPNVVATKSGANTFNAPLNVNAPLTVVTGGVTPAGSVTKESTSQAAITDNPPQSNLSLTAQNSAILGSNNAASGVRVGVGGTSASPDGYGGAFQNTNSAGKSLAALDSAGNDTFAVLSNGNASLADTGAVGYRLNVGGQINATAGLCITGDCRTAWPAGGGTVTQVNSGSGLMGGPITTSGTISVADGGIGTTQLSNLSVTNGKLAGDAVTTDKIADGTITNADINAAAAIDPTKVAGTAATLGANTFTNIQSGPAFNGSTSTGISLSTALGTFSAAVSGNQTATSGLTAGVVGQIATTDQGAGVVGIANAATGSMAPGVAGINFSTSDGANGGAFIANGATGVTFGVTGNTFSSTTGTAGVRGQAHSGGGMGGLFQNSDPTGRSLVVLDSTGFTPGVLTARASGNVGIGTDDRLSRLTVRGKFAFTATGTVTTDGSTTAITGNGTHFTTEVGIGDRVTIGATSQTVNSITSDTQLTVITAFGANSSVTMTVQPSLFRVDNSAGSTQFRVSDQGSVQIGTVAGVTPKLLVSTTSPFTGISTTSANESQPGIVIRSTTTQNTDVGPLLGFSGNTGSTTRLFAGLRGAKENGTSDGTDPVAGVNGYLGFYTMQGGSPTTFAERMRLTSSGNLVLNSGSLCFASDCRSTWGAGTGTVTSVTAGTGLTASPASPITSTGTLSFDTAFGDARYAQLGAANTFTSTLTLAGGNINLPNTTNSSTGVISVGGVAFLHDFGTADTFLGQFAGNFNNTPCNNFGNTVFGNNTAVGSSAFAANNGGCLDTAIGTSAMQFNSTGLRNTAGGAFALRNNSTASDNTAFGSAALLNNTTGTNNTAVGSGTLQLNNTASGSTAVGAYSLQSSTAGNNTGVGSGALFLTTTGGDNTAVGAGALVNNITGTQNTALGSGALSANTTQFGSTAVGYQSMQQNTSGIGNSALGWQTLWSNTTGQANTALGAGALHVNTTGNNNTSVGQFSMPNNTTGCCNVAVGQSAMANNTTGSSNVAVGGSALQNNQVGTNNTAVGPGALSGTTADNNTALGAGAGGANTGGTANTFVGYHAGPAGSGLTNATAIGANAQVSTSNALVLGSGANVGIGTNTPGQKLEVDTNNTTDYSTAVLGNAAGATGRIYGVEGITNSTGTFSAGVEGVSNAATGQTYGVFASINSTTDFAAGVQGGAYANSGRTYGVQGFTNSTTNFAAGLQGGANGASGLTWGVQGYTNSTSDGATGVQGNANGAIGQTRGVAGFTDSTSNLATGVFGSANQSTGQTFGVEGDTSSGTDFAAGVVGNAKNTIGQTRGVAGTTNSSTDLAVGVLGTANANAGATFGIWGLNNSPSGTGVQGNATSSGAGIGVAGFTDSTGGGIGVKGVSRGAGTYGVWAENIGGTAFLSNGNATVTGNLSVSGTTNSGPATVSGNLTVTGTLSKGGGSFKIDHPLDPENKYLYHSFVESPDMMNVYNGNVLLDKKGEAWVELPEWFEMLNRDFRYHLTAIGAPGPNLFISQEIHGNRFKIAGGKSGLKVSWQVTGIRQDPYAVAHRIKTEEDKPEQERGYYLHPEEYGQPKEKGIQYAHHAPEPPSDFRGGEKLAGVTQATRK